MKYLQKVKGESNSPFFIFVNVKQLLFISIASLVFWSCEEEKVKTFKEYLGPAIEAEDITTLYTDSAVLRVKLQAPVQWELQNKDIEFPKGMEVDFYEEDSTHSSKLTANYGYYYSEEKIYKASGNVIINNEEKEETLKTEELFWEPEKQIIHTDKFVRIETPEEILEGEGLEAKEDFSSYKIKKITGTFLIEK